MKLMCKHLGASRRIWEQNNIFKSKWSALTVKPGFISVGVFCFRYCLQHWVVNVLNCIFCKSFNFEVFTDL